VIGIAVDITEQKRLARKTRRGRRLRDAVETISEAFVCGTPTTGLSCAIRNSRACMAQRRRRDAGNRYEAVVQQGAKPVSHPHYRDPD